MKDTPTTTPVVLTSKGVSLANHLKLDELPLATTPGGKNFVMKCLHPSEHTIKSARVPGGNINSAAICTDMVYTVPLQNANAEIRLIQIPSPSVLASVRVENPAGVNPRYVQYNFYNSAFGGAVQENPNYTHQSAVMSKMLESISKYRVTSQSATVELIAPALSDQGTITSIQYQMVPRSCQISSFTGGAVALYPDAYAYPEPMDPSALMGLSAYTAKAREGCYQPLKLNSFKWRDLSDPMLLFDMDVPSLAPYVLNDSMVNNNTWPYYEDREEVTNVAQIATPKFCGSNFGIIKFSGCAANTALRIRVRQTLEIVARPGTLYTPFMEVALPPDDTAMRMVMEVSARMADGYPASYNDLGTLKNIILGIGKKILPFVDPALDALSAVPGPVGTLAGGAKTLVGLGRSVAADVKAKKKKKKAKAAAQAGTVANAKK